MPPKSSCQCLSQLCCGCLMSCMRNSFTSYLFSSSLTVFASEQMGGGFCFSNRCGSHTMHGLLPGGKFCGASFLFFFASSFLSRRLHEGHLVRAQSVLAEPASDSSHLQYFPLLIQLPQKSEAPPLTRSHVWPQKVPADPLFSKEEEKTWAVLPQAPSQKQRLTRTSHAWALGTWGRVL